jgi:glucosylceramidase
VQNDNVTAQSFNIGYQGKNITTTLPAGAVGTYVWR